MKIYVTFGQEHAHANAFSGKTLDKDSVAEIECESVEAGRAKAFELFEDKFFTHYLEDDIRESFMKHFPRGIIKVN